jgi:hypothetical protein
MSTRPLPPQPVVATDPGPWSGVLDVLQRRGLRPGRRRAEPPNGLMLMPAPQTTATLGGLDAALGIAGAGPVRVIAAAREPALALTVGAEGQLVGVSPGVHRVWSLPELRLTAEVRPPADPAAGRADPVLLGDLAVGALPPAAVLAPGGAVAAVPVIESARVSSLAIVRTDDRSVCRLIRFARCGTWSADGKILVIGGDWGLLALEHRDADRSRITR